MLSPITYNAKSTNSQAPGPNALTPSVIIGQIQDYGDNYNVGGIDSLKHFRLSVYSLGGNKLLDLDTLSLYGASYPTQFSDYSKDPGSGPGSPIKGTPVRFQKVHFRGTNGLAGGIHEFYSVFLVSSPVKLDSTATLTEESEFDSEGSYGIGGSYVGREIDAGDANAGTIEEWMPTGNDEKEDFNNRLIISDSLQAQLRGTRKIEGLADPLNPFDGFDLIGVASVASLPFRIGANYFLNMFPPTPFMAISNPPKKIVTNVYTNAGTGDCPEGTPTLLSVTYAESADGEFNWTTKTESYHLGKKWTCSDFIDCIPCDPCICRESFSSFSSVSSESSSRSSKSSKSSSSDSPSSRSSFSSSISSVSSSSHVSSSSSSRSKTFTPPIDGDIPLY